jgi:pyruvate/2-oxoglutarate dehydrogenase complex dihydrolipoamide dehydrogenase (E3) component
MDELFDFVIIGAGPAGEAAAYMARARGASVAIVDRELFGGSCPFWACMPSKTLLYAAAVTPQAATYGWERASARRDFMISRQGPTPRATRARPRLEEPARSSSAGPAGSPAQGVLVAK